MPGFFTAASGAKPVGALVEKRPAPARAPKKASRTHAHLPLSKAGGDESDPGPESVAPRPLARTKVSRASQAPKSVSEEESWARLAAINPCKGKKRKTVHRPECGCFLCALKHEVGHPCAHVCDGAPLQGCMVNRAPLPRVVESAHWEVPLSLNAPFTQSHS